MTEFIILSVATVFVFGLLFIVFFFKDRARDKPPSFHSCGQLNPEARCSQCPEHTAAGEILPRVPDSTKTGNFEREKNH